LLEGIKIAMSSKLVKYFAAVSVTLACSSGIVQGQNAPVPGLGAQSAPVPGTAPQPTRRSNGSLGYGDLPLNADDAKAKIVELTNLVASARPQDLQERVDQLCIWLGDMIEAHNKMANAFSKHDEMKAQCTAERQSAMKFARLKHQAQLLKADLLIGMRRYPEALVPLVDIVTAEPTSETGKGAYKRLQDLGFSQDLADAGDAAPSMVVHELPAQATAKSAAVRKAVASLSKKTGSGDHRR
jgi:hypothetical protein